VALLAARADEVDHFDTEGDLRTRSTFTEQESISSPSHSPVRRFGDERHVGLNADQPDNPLPNDRMIVDAEDADALWIAAHKAHSTVGSYPASR
jgi:hypothetical protein